MYAHHFLNYLSGGSQLINLNGVETLYYGYTDNQGSLIALTDASGNTVEKYAYDPWGARRNPNDWTQNDSRTSFINNRGYTGHEHLDAFGIINMNGRVYDPLTAQFFSPDPFVQAPDNWVNYNRYGYCMNNPLIYTDPTGNLMAWRSLKEGATYQQATSWECGGGIGGGGFDGMSSGGGAGGGGYTYNYAAGTYLNSAGQGVCYNEAFDNYILPNASYYFSGKSAQTAFSYTRDGFSLYSIKFSSGQTSYAASIGDIGKATMDSNGGLSFSNSTAGMISMSMWGGSGESGEVQKAGLGILFDFGSALYGTEQLSLQLLRQNNGAQAVGRFLGFGTQQTAAALRGTTSIVGTWGKNLGTAGMILNTLNYGAQILDPNKTISTATHVNFWVNAGLYGSAAIIGGPIIGGIALAYGIGEVGSYLFTGNTIEENIFGK